MYSEKENCDKNVFRDSIVKRIKKAIYLLNTIKSSSVNFNNVRLKITNNKFKLYILYIDNIELIVGYEVKNPFYNNKILKCDYGTVNEIADRFIKEYNRYNIV